jgi:RNA polymerase sigma factor (sigma-70 family)
MNDTTGDGGPLDSTGHAHEDAASQERRAELNRWLEQAARGDQSAFARLYRTAAPRIFGVIVRMVRDKGEAEDLLQDVFTTAWRSADRFDAARGSAMTWLVTLARNRTIDRMRQHHELPLGDDEPWLDIPDDDPTPAARAEANEERTRLERCLQQLDALHRGVVREAFYTGAAYNDLAERRSVPLGTMKSWIRRSLMQLKACLEQS